jgi:hypothetical protein
VVAGVFEEGIQQFLLGCEIEHKIELQNNNNIAGRHVTAYKVNLK